MSVSALMEAMAAAGAPMEAIILAVRALEAKDAELQAVQQAADAKRAAHAEWKRNRRAEQAVSMDSPRTDDGPSTAIPFPSPSSSPDPSNNPTHTPGIEPRARKGTRISDCWKPEALDGADQAMVAAWPPGTIDREMAKFRDFWAAKAGAGGVKRDWQATWRNWLRSADERIPRNGNRTANHRNFGNANRSSEIDDAARNLGFGG